MLPRSYDSDDSRGVRHDVLVDALLDAKSAKEQFSDVYVTMDGIADDREGIFTEYEMAEVRLMQQTCGALIESLETNIEDIQSELDGVRSQND